MIVDLERNDLARIARTGSVRVDELFAVRRWCDLWQAESTVSATVADGLGLADLLRAVCPGGSVTGAPKRAALEQIAALEPVGRGASMGALGWVAPGRVDLGLTIRTAAVDTDRVHVWAGGASPGAATRGRRSPRPPPRAPPCGPPSPAADPSNLESLIHESSGTSDLGEVRGPAIRRGNPAGRASPSTRLCRVPDTRLSIRRRNVSLARLLAHQVRSCCLASEDDVPTMFCRAGPTGEYGTLI